MKTFAILLSFFSLPVLAAQHSYLISRYPKSESSCHVQGAKLAEIFAQHTGIKEVSSKALEQTKTTCNVLLSYESEKPIPAVSTETEFSTLSRFGIFKTQVECEQGLAIEKEEFQRETGLSPAFCFCLEDTQSETRPWGVRIDAFGESKVKPRLSDILLFGLPVQMTADQYRAQVKEGLEKLGVRVRHVVFHPFAGVGTTVSLHYFHENKFRFTSGEFGDYYKAEECLAELPHARGIFTESAISPQAVLVHCTKNALSIIEMTVTFPAFKVPVKGRLGIERFKLFSECQGERDKWVLHYQKELKEPVIGGFCTRVRDGYAVLMFEVL